jgi:hypothetical protein
MSAVTNSPSRIFELLSSGMSIVTNYPNHA